MLKETAKHLEVLRIDARAHKRSPAEAYKEQAYEDQKGQVNDVLKLAPEAREAFLRYKAHVRNLKTVTPSGLPALTTPMASQRGLRPASQAFGHPSGYEILMTEAQEAEKLYDHFCERVKDLSKKKRLLG